MRTVAGVFFPPLELAEDKDPTDQPVIAASETAGIPIVLPDRFQKRVTIKREASQRAAVLRRASAVTGQAGLHHLDLGPLARQTQGQKLVSRFDSTTVAESIEDVGRSFINTHL